MTIQKISRRKGFSSWLWVLANHSGSPLYQRLLLDVHKRCIWGPYGFLLLLWGSTQAASWYQGVKSLLLFQPDASNDAQCMLQRFHARPKFGWSPAAPAVLLHRSLLGPASCPALPSPRLTASGQETLEWAAVTFSRRGVFLWWPRTASA